MKSIYKKLTDWLFSRHLDKPFSNFFKSILLFGIFIIGIHIVLAIAATPATILWLVIFFGGEYIYNLIPEYITSNEFFSIEAGLFSGLIVLWCIFLIFSICIICWDILVKKEKYSLSEILSGLSGSVLFFAKIFVAINAMFLLVFVIFYFFIGLLGI